MKKITFDFLKTMEIKEIEKSPLTPAASKLPGANAHLRLFADGSLYPSKELVELHNLEFQPQGSALPENGYDVFTSAEWAQYGNAAPNAVPFVCLALVSKHEPRVNLFSQTKYNADTTPKSSVLTQKTTAGEDLIAALNAVYLDKPEESIFGTKPYVDIVIGLTNPLTKSTTGVYHIPKMIVKGKDAGKATYVRRENIQIFPIMIIEEEVAAKVAVPAPAVVAVPAVNTTAKAAAAMFGN